MFSMIFKAFSFAAKIVATVLLIGFVAVFFTAPTIFGLTIIGASAIGAVIFWSALSGIAAFAGKLLVKNKDAS